MYVIQLVISGITTGMIYGLVAIGYHLIFRATNLIDFAQGEKLALGGLFALAITAVIGNNLWIALGPAAIAGYALGWAYERLVLRPTYHRGQVVQIIATVGVAQFLYSAHGLIWGASPLAFPYSLGGDSSQMVFLGSIGILADKLWIWMLVIAVMLLFYVYTEHTRHGQAMVASSENELGARLSGIDVSAMRSQAVAVATALAVIGGLAIAPLTLAGGSIGLPIGIKAFAGAMLGGLNSAFGVVVGSVLVGIIESLAAGLISYGYRDPAAFGVLLVVLLILPNGLFGRRQARVA
jgi:branched-chain amino acid transport system permease protein